MEDETDINLFCVGKPKEKTVHDFPIEKYADFYKMNHASRGKAIIFNHSSFSPQTRQPDRQGTDVDRDNVTDTLQRIGFEVVQHENLKYNQIICFMKKLAEEDHRERDCICFVFLTHGKLNEIYAYDKSYSMDSIFVYLTPDKCSSLTGKPKLFFVQACRGDAKDSGAVVRSIRSSSIEFDSFTAKEKPRPYTIPLYTDFFIGYATLPGFVSWRNPETGSPYIRELCSIFNEQWQSEDIYTMMTRVTRQVAISFESNPSQSKLSPCFTSNLTRMLKF